MIPVSTFNMLIAMGVIFTLFSVIDLRNKIYANIVAGFIAAFDWGYLGTAVTAGIVQYNDGSVIQDASVGMVLFFVAVVMMVYALYMVYEAREEKRMEAEAV